MSSAMSNRERCSLNKRKTHGGQGRERGRSHGEGGRGIWVHRTCSDSTWPEEDGVLSFI